MKKVRWSKLKETKAVQKATTYIKENPRLKAISPENWKFLLIGGGLALGLLGINSILGTIKRAMFSTEVARTVAASEGGGSRLISVNPEILKKYPIKMTQLVEMTPSEELVLPGRIQTDAAHTALVSARVSGRVIALHVKEANDVKKGQVVATLQSTELAQSQADHLKSFNHYILAEQQMNRLKELFDHEIVAAREHDIAVAEYKSAKAQLAASRIQLSNFGLSQNEIQKLEENHTSTGEVQVRSPISGVVIQRHAALGQLLKAEDTVITVGNIDRLWVVLDAYEKDVALIEEGIEAQVLLPTSSGETKPVPAKVSRVSHVIDSSTRSAKVWLEVSNLDEELRVGQSVSARIKTGTIKTPGNTIHAITHEAVHSIEGKSIVFVQKDANHFEPREVDTGWSSDQWIEIQSGVKPGESVAASGSFILKSEMMKN